jgi:hypothetical protein
MSTNTDQLHDQISYVLKRAVATAGVPIWHDDDLCGICYTAGPIRLEVAHRPHVCTCSDTTRPTMADPCGEVVQTLVCRDCTPLLERDDHLEALKALQATNTADEQR